MHSVYYEITSSVAGGMCSDQMRSLYFCSKFFVEGLATNQLGQDVVGCLTPQQHDRVSQGRICSDKFTCCHTEIEVADQTFYLTQSQYADTRPSSAIADPIRPGVWQSSHWSVNF